jgi:hypothetical protein
MPNLDLTDDEHAALVRLVEHALDTDRFPMSPRLYPLRVPPIEWARLAITAYRTHRADRIVAEVNNGGGMEKRNSAGRPQPASIGDHRLGPRYSAPSFSSSARIVTSRRSRILTI